ncbi:hypothetical protein B0H17DRAFT_1180086 [Mycena rosella]|uniref:Uncharacterized protein n=1 Tax=Mycena rosella TaxID=1033263 RepID=A0AAD7GIP9_MYCRO|nr:hypothetical protein B0H17DRAFT_1180086 [Mycena rosella]
MARSAQQHRRRPLFVQNTRDFLGNRERRDALHTYFHYQHIAVPPPHDEYMLDAQMPRWGGNISVMCSTEDVHDFQNLNKYKKLMAQSCVAWYMLYATIHSPANNNSLVHGHLLQMESKTQYTVDTPMHLIISTYLTASAEPPREKSFCSGASHRFEHGCSGVFIGLDSPPAADNGPAVQATVGMPRSPLTLVRKDAPAAPGEAAAAAADAAQTAANTSTNTVASHSGSAAANDDKNSVLKKRKVGEIVNKAPHRRMRSATPALT